jgi:hypothetical protein
MHIPTHVMSGWCIGASLPLTARERLACVLTASGADLDGMSLAWGWAAYRRWHHVLGHNVFFGLLLALLCARLAAPGHRVMMTAMGLVLFHVHLVLDYYGSGSGWPIYYLWPFSRFGWVNPEAWDFGGWQSYATMTGLLLWTVAIALFKRCTPFELIAPGLENDWRNLLSRFGSNPAPDLLTLAPRHSPLLP